MSNKLAYAMFGGDADPHVEDLRRIYGLGAAISKILHAATASGTESVVMLKGTPPANTEHVATIYAADHEGVYRPYYQDEDVWSGGRWVRNELKWSEDFSNPVWVKTNVSVSGTEVIATSVSGLNVGQKLNDDSYSTSSTIALKTITATTGWEKYSVAGSKEGRSTIVRLEAKAGTVNQFRLQIYGSSSSGTAANIITAAGHSIGDSFHVRNVQAENATGRSDTSTPSEYQKTEAAPVTKVFATTNGNTVDGNGVVTEAEGVVLDPPPELVSQDEGNSLTPWSRDLTQWYTNSNVAVAYDQTGIDGKISASKCEDSNAGVSGYSRDRFIVNDGNYVFRLFVNKEASATAVSCFRFTDVVAATTTAFILDLVTGITYTASWTLPDGLEVVDDGDRWGVYGYITQATTNNFEVSDYPAWRASGGGNTDISALGFNIVGNFELYADKTISEVKALGPIFTEGAAASTDALRPDYAAANLEAEEGTLSFDIDWLGQATSILSNGVNLDLSIAETGIITLSDGTNSVTSPVIAQGKHNVGAVWGGGTMNLSVNSTLVGEQPYTTFGSGDLVQGITGKELEVWDAKNEGRIS